MFSFSQNLNNGVYKDTCKDGHFDSYKCVYLTDQGL